MQEQPVSFQWPAEGLSRVPFNVYNDDSLYAAEQERIFRGETWSFLCLESDLPEPETYYVSSIGEMPVAVTRGRDGVIHAFENRCAHRGSLLFLEKQGKARNAVCVYHNWSYDLKGNLRSVAFKNGVGGQGGMPECFHIEDHGPRKLRVETLAGLVFGSLSKDGPDLQTYITAPLVDRIKKVLRKPPIVLGTITQVMHNNWKLYFENVKDSYHASLLHVFFTTFKITRLSFGGGILIDPSGAHHTSFTQAGALAEDPEYDKEKLRSNKEGEFGLKDTSLLQRRDEIGDGNITQILSVFPSFALQAHINSLAVRRVVPKSSTETHLEWTFLGYADDDEELRALRLKHSNLVGPAGYVSMEDGAVGGFVQRGTAAFQEGSAIVEMGGHGTESSQTRATEASVRGFWKAYRTYMGIA